MMSNSEFVERYGGVYEHSPWVAERVSELVADPADTEIIVRLMADCVDNASKERRLALICAHPDLAGKAHVAGKLTADSSEEQASAGLDQCTSDEYERLQELNSSYRNKFGFPFVMAVRKSDRVQILAAFEERLGNDYDLEFETALDEIHKIARLRLRAIEDGK
jgi:OHCU decarboxylase